MSTHELIDVIQWVLFAFWALLGLPFVWLWIDPVRRRKWLGSGPQPWPVLYLCVAVLSLQSALDARGWWGGVLFGVSSTLLFISSLVVFPLAWKMVVLACTNPPALSSTEKTIAEPTGGTPRT